MTKNTDDWMPLHIGEYLADTTNLTRDQHGAYLLLIMAYWRRGSALPADDGQLAAMAKASPAEWRKLKRVIAPLFREEDGKWFQKRCEAELAKARQIMAAKSEAGKLGAQKRWHKDDGGNGGPDGTGIAEAPVSQCQTDAPRTSNQEPEAAVAAAKQADANEINRLSKLLGFDDRDFLQHSRNIEALIALKTDGCDFESHIWPAALAAAKGGRARSVNYLRARAIELRDAQRTVSTLPIPFEQVDLQGWINRVRVWRTKGLWAPKFGPAPNEPGCKCPPEILTAEIAA